VNDDANKAIMIILRRMVNFFLLSTGKDERLKTGSKQRGV
jgi:hypothetical protein